MTSTVLIDTNEGVASVKLNRAEAYNALDLQMGMALAAGLTALGSDPAVRAIVISGNGKAFCSGGDLKWAMSASSGAAAAFHQLAGHFHLAITEIRRMPKPVIAAVNGVAAGGGFSLALACDFRVMAKSAVLRQAYTSSGLCLDGGGTFTLPRLLGLARALEIVAFDQAIPAEQALAWGLATRVVDDAAALTASTALALDLAQKSLHAFGAAKMLLTDSFDTPLEAQIERERRALCACAEHPEGREGLRAFAEKRKPRYA